MRKIPRPVHLLRDHKKFQNFCVRYNKDVGCKDSFMCGTVCPAWMLKEIEFLMTMKNLPLHEAYKIVWRKDIEDKVRRKIIKEYASPRREYPEGNLTKALDEIWKRIGPIIREVLDEYGINKGSRDYNKNRGGDSKAQGGHGHKSIEIRGTTEGSKR